MYVHKYFVTMPCDDEIVNVLMCILCDCVLVNFVTIMTTFNMCDE